MASLYEGEAFHGKQVVGVLSNRPVDASMG
jgi:hypothetical protein